MTSRSEMNDLDDIAAIVYGSPVPAKASEADEEAQKRDRLSQAVAALHGTIAVVKEGIETGDLSRAAEAWFELTNEERESIWVSPTRTVNGKRVLNEHAPFTTREREVIKSAEFRQAHFGASE